MQLLGNYHPNFAILLTSQFYKPNENGPIHVINEVVVKFIKITEKNEML